MTRAETLERAKAIVTGKREKEYGDPEDSFRMIAELWSAYLKKYIKPEDVAIMMILLKVARVQGKGGTEDCFVDMAGYSACGCEIWARSRANTER